MESKGIAEGQAPVVQEPYLPSLQRGFGVRYREDEDARVVGARKGCFGESRTDEACQFSQRVSLLTMPSPSGPSASPVFPFSHGKAGSTHFGHPLGYLP